MGAFDGKFWNWTRNDEKDMEAAERQALKFEQRAQNSKDLANRKKGELLMGAGADIDAIPEVIEAPQSAPGAPVRIPNMRSKRAIKRLQAQNAEAMEAVTDSLEALTGGLESQREYIKAVRKRSMQNEERLGQMRDILKKRFESSESNFGMLSSTSLAVVSALVEAINVGDVVQVPALNVIAIGLDAAAQSGQYEGNTKKMIQMAAILCKAIAYWDLTIGITSVFSNDSGGLLPNTGTTAATGGTVRGGALGF